jgi:hypothetical protein
MAKFDKQDIHDWINTQDHSTYVEKVYPVLRQIATWNVEKYARNWYWFADTREDLVTDMITHTALQLPKHDPNKSNVVTYMHRIMRNYIYREFAIHSYQKRNRRNTLHMEDMVDPFGHLIEMVSPPEEYNLWRDPHFIKSLVDYWRSHKFPNKSSMKSQVLLLVDIIENPDDHIDAEFGLTEYFCKKYNCTRQRLHQVYDYMRKYNKVILDNFIKNNVMV